MPRYGISVADLTVDILGPGPFCRREDFSPRGESTLVLMAQTADGPMRPARPPTVECDTWAAFCEGGRLTLVSQIRTWSPREFARIDFDRDGRSGTLAMRPGLTVDPFNYPLDQLVLIHLLSQHGGMLLHAASVVIDDQAYLIAGPSGEGKTTFCRAAAQLPGVTVLSDERTIVRERDGRWFAHGTPWFGEGQYAECASAPLMGIYALDKSDKDAITTLSPVRAMAALVRCHFPASWTGDAASQIAVLEALVLAVPCFRLRTRESGQAHEMIASRPGQPC